jgi:hypothetical protein
MMLNKEQRSETRFELTQKNKGMLFLHVQGECLPVHAICNISQTGVSLLFDYDVNKGDHVEVEYKDRKNGVKVSGMVVWQRPADEANNSARHLLGISMFSPNLLLSFMPVA